jgi:hypothetical protein
VADRRLPRGLFLVTTILLGTSSACFFSPPPVLPARFEGALSATADSLVSSTTPARCANVRHLDFGTTPQGCLRTGDTRGWVNWRDASRVTKVGREWLHPDELTALGAGRVLEADLEKTLGAPTVCRYKGQWTLREVRWIATEPSGISTALIVWGNDPRHTATPRVILLRTLGPEGCGNHLDRPHPR